MTIKLRIIEWHHNGYNVERLIIEPDGKSLVVPYWKPVGWGLDIEHEALGEV